MSTLPRLVLGLLLVASAGCAYRPPLHSQSINAQVISGNAYATTPKTDIGVGIPVPGGLVFAAPIAVPISRDSYLYELRLGNGKLIRTNSQRSFRPGDCVTLWHASNIDQVNGEFNVIAGTLEPSTNCS